MSELPREERGKSQAAPLMPQGCLTLEQGALVGAALVVFLSIFIVLLLWTRGLGREGWEVPGCWEVNSGPL